MGNGTVAKAAAAVRNRLDAANGVRPERGGAPTVAWGSPGPDRQMPWWVAAGQRIACRTAVHCPEITPPTATRPAATRPTGTPPAATPHQTTWAQRASVLRVAGWTGCALVGQGWRRQPEDRNHYQTRSGE
jgi:hypothetical protein